MTRFALPILIASAALAQPEPAGLLANVRKAYSQATAMHIVATRIETVSGNGGSMVSEAEYELAEKPPGRFRARVREGNADGIAVSDGSTTWKAAPGSKQWMKIEAASDSEDDEDVPADGAPKDLHDRVASTLLRRIMAIVRLAERPEILKQDTLKIDGRQAPCYVVRTYVGPVRHDLWIDQQRYLVLRDAQSGVSKAGGGAVSVGIETKVKRFELNAEVADSLFTFEPEKKWAEVEMLVLPGEERVSFVGRPAADFTLKSVEGVPLQLSGLRGKVVVMDFWATWCGPCREELPVIQKLKTEFAGSVEFVGVNDEDVGTVKGFLKKKGYTFTVAMDGKREVHRRYGVHGIPTVLVIDRQGVVRQHFVGGRSEQTLRAAIESALGRGQ